MLRRKLCIVSQEVTNRELWNISGKKSENCSLCTPRQGKGTRCVQLYAFLPRLKQDVIEKLQATVAEIRGKILQYPLKRRLSYPQNTYELAGEYNSLQFSPYSSQYGDYKGCDKIIIHVKYVLTTLRQISSLYLQKQRMINIKYFCYVSHNTTKNAILFAVSPLSDTNPGVLAQKYCCFFSSSVTTLTQGSFTLTQVFLLRIIVIICSICRQVCVFALVYHLKKREKYFLKISHCRTSLKSVNFPILVKIGQHEHFA